MAPLRKRIVKSFPLLSADYITYTPGEIPDTTDCKLHISKLTTPQETFFAYPRKCIHQDAVGLLKRWLKLKTQTVQRDVVIREISIWTNCVCCHITCSLKQPFADHYHHPGRWYTVGHFIVLVYWGIAQYTSRQDIWHGGRRMMVDFLASRFHASFNIVLLKWPRRAWSTGWTKLDEFRCHTPAKRQTWRAIPRHLLVSECPRNAQVVALSLKAWHCSQCQLMWMINSQHNELTWFDINSNWTLSEMEMQARHTSEAKSRLSINVDVDAHLAIV